MAGTGKTLIGLAASLEQRRNYKQIYLARPIVPLSNKDIGYLPGDIKSKLSPYMEPLWDNLKFIQNQWKESDKEYARINEMVTNEKLVITPLAYIRGRSLSNICFIVDEAQNLTPHEVKTIITRAGENTKIIFTGDINQIDTPYLDSQSNGAPQRRSSDSIRISICTRSPAGRSMSSDTHADDSFPSWTIRTVDGVGSETAGIHAAVRNRSPAKPIL